MDNRIWKTLGLIAVAALVLGFVAMAGTGVSYAATYPLKQSLSAPLFGQVDPDKGLVIVIVDPDGPAAAADIVRGDILQAIDGQEVDTIADLQAIVTALSPGDTIRVTVLHGDDIRTLPLTVGERLGIAYLGITPFADRLVDRIMEFMPEQTHMGAMLVEVAEDSPAAKAGLETGDVILAVDGKAIDEEHSLADLIAAYKPGDTITLEIASGDGENREVEVTLAEHPDKEGIAYLGVRFSATDVTQGFDLKGLPFGDNTMPFRDLPFDLKQLPEYFNPENWAGGAMVREVAEDSPAAAAGLEAGDIIVAIDDEPVTRPSDVPSMIAEREPGDKVTLTVRSIKDGEERTVEVTLGEHPDKEGAAYLGVALGGFVQLDSFRGQRQGPVPRGVLPFFRFRRGPFKSPSTPDDGQDFYRNFPFQGFPFDLEDLKDLPQFFDFQSPQNQPPQEQTPESGQSF